MPWTLDDVLKELENQKTSASNNAKSGRWTVQDVEEAMKPKPVLEKDGRTRFTPEDIREFTSPVKLPNVTQTKEAWLDKFKKGNILGGLGQLGLETLGAAQTGLLNVSKNIINLTQGKPLEWKSDYSYAEYAKDVAPQHPITKAIHSDTFGGNVLRGTTEILSDPLTFIGGGIIDDLARTGRLGKAAIRGTTENLKIGASVGEKSLKKLKVPKTANVVDDTVQSINPQRYTVLDTTEASDGTYAYIKNNKTGKESFVKIADNLTPKVELPKIEQPTELPEPVNKIVLESPKKKLDFKSALNKFYTRVVDTQKPISDFSKKAGDDTAILASNTRNVGGTVDYILKEGLVDRQGNKIGKSFKEVAEQIPKGKEKDFWEYMAQRHNIDRAKEGKNVIANYTSEMSEAAVKEIEKANPQFKAIGDEITGWIDKFMREWGVNAGIVDADLYKQLRQTYKSYFPTQREFSQLEKSMPEGVRKQFVDQTSPIGKATGSERDINNPLENIMNLVNRTVRIARYNEVAQSLLESVRKQPEKLKELAEIIPATEGMFNNVDNIVTVMENGKPVYLKINNKELLDALKGLPKIINNAKVVRWFTNKFKALVTNKNPLFAIRNIFRDIPTAYVYGSESNPFKFGTDLVKAGKDILTNSENFQRYRALGGGMSSFFSSSKAEKVAKDLLKKPNILQRVGNVVETFNNIAEITPRLAEFNRVLDRTGDVQKALAAANDVTVNFARGGDITKTAEAFVPYLNAGVQGFDKFFRSFKDPKTALKTLAKGGIAITLPEVALYLINKDNPNYQALDNRTKDTYYLIPNIFDKDENGYAKTFIKIPKARELGTLFGALFQRIFRAASGEEEAFKGFGKTVATNFAPTNPIENNIIAPIAINIPKNKDFAGRSIVPLGMLMDKRSPYLQYDEKTSEIAKAIGEYSSKVIDGGISPKQIDYLIKSYTGVIGQLGLPLATKGGDALKAVTSSFIADPLYNNKTMQDFYEKYDKLQRAATDKNLIEGIPSKKVTTEEKLRNEFRKANDKISELNKVSARVNSGNTNKDDDKILKKYNINTSSPKEELLKAIRIRQLEIAKQALMSGQK